MIADRGEQTPFGCVFAAFSFENFAYSADITSVLKLDFHPARVSVYFEPKHEEIEAIFSRLRSHLPMHGHLTWIISEAHLSTP